MLNRSGNKILYAFFLLILSIQANAQNNDALQEQVAHFLASKNAFVGLAVWDSKGAEILSFRGDDRFPMQSVFKFHIGLTMLAEIDKGRFSLDQKITIEKSELLPGLYSPIREKYPEGSILSIAEILEYTVSLSDNVGCDILLKLLGGPDFVEGFIRAHGIEGISIKINEEVMQSNWDLQFQNWTSPNAANRVLHKFFLNSNQELSSNSYHFIWKIMSETATGANRLKGKLPTETVVAHKTGWSGKNEETGITAAVNDMGIVFLPNGEYFIISVFVSDSKEEPETNEEIIANIAKACWDFFGGN
jgi:beta-lactamase class A